MWNGGAFFMLKSISDLSKTQFDTELQKGMDDITAGQVLPADTVEIEMRTLYVSKYIEENGLSKW